MAIGDHLKVNFGFYCHHGIDVGNGDVVHFGRGLHDIENAVIEQVSREIFCQGRPISIVEGPSEFSPADIVDRALSRIGEQGYDLADNNCEHFSHWCRSGEARSRQSDYSETVVRQSVSVMSKPLVRQSVLHSVRKIASSTVAKKLSGGQLLGLISRSARGAWVADAAQAAVELAATSKGKSKSESRCLGRGTGVTVAACAGFFAAGRMGGVAGVAFWAVGQLVGKRVFENGKKQLRANTA